MVEVINKAVCRGVAGRRSGNVKGVVIHNTADNGTAVNHMNRLGGYSNLQLQNGFAHYFIDEDTIVRTEDTYNMAWHTANSDGNANYIGYEVCRSTGNEKQFLQAEQNTFKQVAEDLKYYGLQANRDTVRLHKEFVATACPHRSWDLHGKSVNSVKDYFIKEIKKYMNGGNTVNKPNEAGGTPVAKVKNNRKPHFVVTGDYKKATVASRKVENFLKKEGMKHKVVSDKKDRAKVWFVVGRFGQDSTWKLKLEQFLQDNNYSYVVCLEKQTQLLIDKW